MDMSELTEQMDVLIQLVDTAQKDLSEIAGRSPDQEMPPLPTLIDAVRDKLKQVEDQRSQLKDAVNLILPLAKAYVAKNQVGSNQHYIDTAKRLVEPSTDDEPETEDSQPIETCGRCQEPIHASIPGFCGRCDPKRV